jgi:two-component sensor histidine kinase
VGLQAHLLSDQAAKDALEETQARIYAIGEIHKRLYTANDIRFVRIDEYLTSLVEHLDASLSAQGSGAEALVSADPVLVATDKAVSIGVAVTELVTNAFKYAYPEGKAGKVELTLRRIDDGSARLAVRDYGVGWKEGEPIKGTGLGTRIIRAMATSLETEIVHQRREQGTEVSFSFATQ